VGLSLLQSAPTCPATGCWLASLRVHLSRSPRPNQRVNLHRPDLYKQRNITDHHKLFVETDPMRQLRRDGDGRGDDIHPNCIIYIAKTIYIFLYFTIFFYFFLQISIIITYLFYNYPHLRLHVRPGLLKLWVETHMWVPEPFYVGLENVSCKFIQNFILCPFKVHVDLL